jgi:hypothetical protein
MADIKPVASRPCTSEIGREVQALFTKFEQSRLNFIEIRSKVSSFIKKNETDLSDLVDIGFLYRELSVRADEMRKDCNAMLELLAKILCHNVAKRSIELGNVLVEPKGVLATANCEIQEVAQCPLNGTPEYTMVLTHLGVKDQLLLDTGMLKIDWNKFQEYIQLCNESGKPLPPGITKKWEVAKVTYRRKH